MKWILVAVATVVLAAGCSSDYDRYLPKYGAARTVASPTGPVVFTVGLDLNDEMRMFHIVNSKVKSVPTDLAAELLRQAIEKEGKQFVVVATGTGVNNSLAAFTLE